MLRAGRLHHRLTLLEPVGFPPDWTSRGEVWGGVEPRRVNREDVTDGTALRIPVTVHLRAKPVIPAPGWRLQLGARVFRVEAVANIEERGERLELAAFEYQGRPGFLFMDGTPYDITISAFRRDYLYANEATRTMEQVPMVEILASELPRRPRAEDLVVVDMQGWAVRQIAEDGDDGFVMRLMVRYLATFEPYLVTDNGGEEYLVTDNGGMAYLVRAEEG